MFKILRIMAFSLGSLCGMPKPCGEKRTVGGSWASADRAHLLCHSYPHYLSLAFLCLSEELWPQDCSSEDCCLVLSVICWVLLAVHQPGKEIFAKFVAFHIFQVTHYAYQVSESVQILFSSTWMDAVQTVPPCCRNDGLAQAVLTGRAGIVHPVQSENNCNVSVDKKVKGLISKEFLNCLFLSGLL